MQADRQTHLSQYFALLAGAKLQNVMILVYAVLFSKHVSHVVGHIVFCVWT